MTLPRASPYLGGQYQRALADRTYQTGPVYFGYEFRCTCEAGRYATFHARSLKEDLRGFTQEGKKDGAVEWIRTTTVLLPPAPQAGASASSATTAQRKSTFIVAAPGITGKASLMPIRTGCRIRAELEQR